MNTEAALNENPMEDLLLTPDYTDEDIVAANSEWDTTVLPEKYYPMEVVSISTKKDKNNLPFLSVFMKFTGELASHAGLNALVYMSGKFEFKDKKTGATRVGNKGRDYVRLLKAVGIPDELISARAITPKGVGAEDEFGRRPVEFFNSQTGTNVTSEIVGKEISAHVVVEKDNREGKDGQDQNRIRGLYQLK